MRRSHHGGGWGGGTLERLRFLLLVVVVTITLGITYLHSLVPHPGDVERPPRISLPDAKQGLEGLIRESQEVIQGVIDKAIHIHGNPAPPSNDWNEPADVDIGHIGEVVCDEKADDARYWKVLPEDIQPSWGDIVRDHEQRRYVTYEPDHGGWNNIRMGMEIFALLALSTGRTLVLPPSESFYLLHHPVENDTSHEHSRGPKLGFSDFFDLKRLEHQGSVISMEEFLRREALTGRLRNPLPGGDVQLEGRPLWQYLRKASGFSTSEHYMHPGKHVFGIAPGSVKLPGMTADYRSVWEAPEERMGLMKMFAEKREVVDMLTDERTKDAINWHFVTDNSHQLRWLSHAYTVLWWADPVQERFWRRYQRDGLRYRDEIICACAKAVRHLKEVGGGSYASYHIRRGDFQFEKARIPIEEILFNTKGNLRDGELIYIATDERNAAEFAPFTAAGYKVLRLDDVADIVGLNDLPNPNWIGMIEQVIASQGRVFHGTYWSTFTGFIIRMRGYMGLGRTNFYSMDEYFGTYTRVRNKYNVEGGSGWWREWEISWDGIDESAL